jgi:hypothetical protein
MYSIFRGEKRFENVKEKTLIHVSIVEHYFKKWVD